MTRYIYIVKAGSQYIEADSARIATRYIFDIVNNMKIGDEITIDLKHSQAWVDDESEIPTTCPDCKLEDQLDQFCRFCQQHFGPNTNRPY